MPTTELIQPTQRCDGVDHPRAAGQRAPLMHRRAPGARAARTGPAGSAVRSVGLIGVVAGWFGLGVGIALLAVGVAAVPLLLAVRWRAERDPDGSEEPLSA